MESQPPFRAIYDDHFVFVWQTLQRWGVRRVDATDVAQKVFLTAHLRLPHYEGRSSVEGWLRGICRRVASDYRRSAVIRNEVPVDPSWIDLEIHLHDEAPEAPTRQPKAKAIIEIALKKLSEPQRVVFSLFELGQVSGPDIAALLHISPGTVRSRLRLARRRFRRELVRLLKAVDGSTSQRRATRSRVRLGR